MEKLNIIGISENIKLLKSLPKDRVILLSDMYLRSNTIRSILTSIDPYFSDIQIYVSCEHGCTKKSGKLFKLVANKLDVRTNQIQHFGNDQQSDIKGAEKAKVKATELDLGNLNYWEQKWLEKLGRSSLFGQKIVGACRQARVLNRCTISKEKIEIACSIAAPTLWLFCRWLVETAKTDKIERLLFISRDGAALRILSHDLCSDFGITSEYLYGSRKSWRRSKYTDTNISDKEHLEESNRSDLVKRYFKQFSLDQTNNWAMVDLGWRGRLQDDLASYLGDEKCKGLFFGLLSYSKQNSNRITRNAYLFDFPEGRKINFGIIPLIESFCTDTHGTVLGYTLEESGIIAPVFTSNVLPELESWGVKDVHQCYHFFASSLVECDKSTEVDWSQARSATLHVLKILANNPTESISKSWGSFPYEDEIDNNGIKSLASPLGWADVFSLIPVIKIKTRPLWFHGSLACSTFPKRVVGKLIQILKDTFERIGSLF